MRPLHGAQFCVGEIANPAVCSKRATLLGNVDRANRKQLT